MYLCNFEFTLLPDFFFNLCWLVTEQNARNAANPHNGGRVKLPFAWEPRLGHAARVPYLTTPHFTSIFNYNNETPPDSQRHRIPFGDHGSTVTKVLCYNSEGLWFDPSWCHRIFIDIKSFRSHYGPGVDSAFNRNEYQVYFLGVKAAGA